MASVPLLRRLELVALRPDATQADIELLCAEARQHSCLAVNVCTSRIQLAANLLEDTTVKIGALIAFPFGACDSDVKRFETESAIDNGAQEIEFVINPGWLKEGNDRALLREMRDIREAAEERTVKATIEMGLLTPDEIRRAAALVVEAELQFVVTATGCAPAPPSLEGIQQIRDAAGPELGIKAVGGIVHPEQAEQWIIAGANRIGVFDLSTFLPANS